MRRLITPVLGLAIALVLGASLMLAGCGTSDESSVKTYTDSDYGYSFDYPSDWQVTTIGETTVDVGGAPTAQVIAVDPEGSMSDSTGLDLCTVRVYELGQAVDDSMLPQIFDYLQGSIATLQSQDPSVKVEASLADTTVGGISGYEITYTLDWPDGTPLRSTSYYLFAGTLEYELIVQASVGHWDANQDVFSTFVASFTPGGTD